MRAIQNRLELSNRVLIDIPKDRLIDSRSGSLPWLPPRGRLFQAERLLDLLDRELRVVLLTGRPVRVRPQTQAWLVHHGLRWDLLVMRDRLDYAHADRFKQTALSDLRAFGFDPVLAFEDDPRNRDMFHSEGVPCIYIHSGYYD